MNETFDLRRLWLLIRNDIVTDAPSFLVVWGVLAALMLLTSMTKVAQSDVSPTFYAAWYIGMLLIWGAFVASRSFAELYDKTRNEAYLLLPASVHEKLVARMLRVVVFFVCLLIFLTVTSAVIESINQLWFGRHNGIFNPFAATVWSAEGHGASLAAQFLVVASLYFLGATWFRKTPFIKTALALTAIPIGLGVLAICLLAILFHGHYEIQIDQFQAQAYYDAHETLARGLLTVLWIFYFFVLPVFCWALAWLRLREAQVSDGI